jgi:hypothetical protein
MRYPWIVGVMLLAAPMAHAASCANGVNVAGCVGPNGAATYNKNTGQAHTAQPSNYNSVAPGTRVQGYRGNSATKAMQPGCAWVNGRRVCN